MYKKIFHSFCMGFLLALCMSSAHSEVPNVDYQHSSQENKIEDDLGNVLENSPVIKAEKARLDAAIEKFNQAYRGRLPDVRADLSYGIQRAKRGNLPVDQYPEQAYAVTLTQDIYTGGRLTAEAERARYEMEQAASKLIQVKNDEALRFLNIYVLLYSNIESQKLSKKNIELLQQTVKMLRQQIKVGEAADIDLTQAKSRLRLEEANLKKLISEYEVLLVRYSNLAHIEPSQSYQSPEKYCKIFADRDLIYNSIIENNPRLLASKYNVKSASEVTNIADAANSPKLAFIAQHSYREGESVFFQDENNTLSGVFQLTIPIFERGLAEPREREAKALESAAFYDYGTEKDAILEEFEELYRFYDVTKYTIDAQKEVVKTNKSLLEAAMEEQRLGFKSVYELLEIERDLVESEYDLVRSQAEHVFSACRILSLQGLLIAPPPEPIETMKPVDNIN